MNYTASTSDGAVLNIETFGEKSNPKLLLSNSLGTDISMWQPQIDALSDRFYIACYDTRGHGKTNAPAGEYTVDQLGGDALAVADLLSWDTFNFAGVSMGAMTGFWLAINAADRILKVLAASGGPMAGGPDPWNARIASIHENGMGPIENSLERWFTPSFVDSNPELIKKFKAAHSLCSQSGYIGCCAALRDLDLRSGLAQINVPMLIVAGEYDTTPPPSVLKMASDYVPGSRFEIVPAGHLCNVEAASEFNRLLTDFL